MTTYSTPTAEQIARHYSSAMDSVNLINELMALDVRDDEQTADVTRNAEHLKIMVAEDYWTIEDLTPFNDAITSALDV